MLSAMSPKTFATALLLALPLPAIADGPPCLPCAGLAVSDPFAADAALAAHLAESGSPLAEGARLYVAWDVSLDAAATPAAAHALAARGAIPWMRLVFRTPAPLFEHVDRLQSEIDAAVALAETRIEGAHFQLVWAPEGATADPSPADYAFLVKRAAVALTGADPEARVVAGPLPAQVAWLANFYAQEVAAYLDGVALAAPAHEEHAARAA